MKQYRPQQCPRCKHKGRYWKSSRLGAVGCCNYGGKTSDFTKKAAEHPCKNFEEEEPK